VLHLNEMSVCMYRTCLQKTGQFRRAAVDVHNVCEVIIVASGISACNLLS